MTYDPRLEVAARSVADRLIRAAIDDSGRGHWQDYPLVAVEALAFVDHLPHWTRRPIRDAVVACLVGTITGLAATVHLPHQRRAAELLADNPDPRVRLNVIACLGAPADAFETYVRAIPADLLDHIIDALGLLLVAIADDYVLTLVRRGTTPAGARLILATALA